MQRRDAYGWGIAAMGLVLGAIQLVQGGQQLSELVGLSNSDLVLVFAFETVPFALVGLSLVYIGYWLTEQPGFERDLLRILGWGAGGTVMFASIAALILFSQQVTLDTLAQGRYITMNLLTVGAVVGLLVGVYDAQSRLRHRSLRRQSRRYQQLRSGAESRPISRRGERALYRSGPSAVGTDRSRIHRSRRRRGNCRR